MKWIVLLAFSLVLTSRAQTVGGDDQYLGIYSEIQQADSFSQGGQPSEAAPLYQRAQSQLRSFQQEFPTWNPGVVKFRLQYLADKLQALAKFLPPTNTPPPAQASRPLLSSEDMEHEITHLQAANENLKAKLKEAQSGETGDTAKTQAAIAALEKDKDALSASLEKEKTDNEAAQAQLAQLKDSAADSEKKLASANEELTSLKADHSATAPASDDLKQLTEERDRLKEELAARSKDLADAEATHNQELSAARAAQQQADQQRDALQNKPAATGSSTPSAATTPSETEPAPSVQVEQLRARLAVLEAAPVPYTPEELAILNNTTSHPPAQLPTASAGPRHVIHSSKDLPPGAGALMAEALRATMQQDYKTAEQKYEEILRQDENDVYVLAYLANAQFADNQLAQCEKTVARALALDPDDAASLYLLGVLRYRQNKLDEAFDALSRSAQFNPTNSATQNYLGCVLADKGLRSAAETALRKALQADPNYADAHYNLAFIYATDKPPAPELALWHYKRALELGHEKNAALEKLLPIKE